MVCDPYVELEYWVLGYAEQELECVHGAGTRGFGGYSFTEEELREFARAERRKRIVKQIKELERQLTLERSWTEAEYSGQLRTIVDEIHQLEARKTARADEHYQSIVDEIRVLSAAKEHNRRKAIFDEIADLERRKTELEA